jgi:hypothetical protein
MRPLVQAEVYRVIEMCLQTGFEFRKRRAFPIVEGVVVAAENEGALLEV